MFVDECNRALETKFTIDAKWIWFTIRNADTFIALLCCLMKVLDIGSDQNIYEQFRQKRAKTFDSSCNLSEIIKIIIGLQLPGKINRLR
jgi:hypothetical protein